jgi:FKBP-type peptidyl-prolyl cis-trans isomerase
VKPAEAVVEFAVEDLVLGGGAECLSGNPIVTIQYRGMLLDGREFDSSYERGAPIVAPLDSLIPGWQQGIPGMKVGGKRRLTVPADLAYSGMAAVQASDAGGSARSREILIPPGSTLVFEIELLALSSGEEAAAPSELARRARE